MTERFVGTHIRFAVVVDVDYGSGIMRTQWLDNNSEPAQIMPIPHPFPGRGEGIYIGIRPGTLVALGMGSYERYVPVAIIPMRGFYADDLSGITEMRFDDVGFPQVESGEIVLQDVTGARLHMRSDGGIGMRNAFGEGFLLGGDYDEAHRCGIVRLPPVKYEASQAGLLAVGVVRRDLRYDRKSVV